MSIQLANKYDKNAPYHIYYDLDAINNETSGNQNQPVRFTITDVRNQPFLNSPENYFMSVVRFSLQTPTLPVFLPQVRLSQSNVNQLTYSFTVSYTHTTGTVYNSTQNYITYVPLDTTQPLPSPPLTLQDITSEYYYIFNLNDFCTMMNTALAAAVASLIAVLTGASITPPSTNVPFFEWNPVNQVFILNADAAGYSNALANPIRIFCNTAMYTLINNFPFIKNSPVGVSLGKNYQFTIFSNNGTNVYPFSTYNAIQMYQDNSTIALFNPVQSVVFTTSLLPIVNSVIGLPKIFNSSTYNLSSVGNNSNISPIITDFVVPVSAINSYRPNIEYVPNGEYRLIDLYGLSPQNSMEITVLWKDNYGGTHIFMLGAGCSASIKLLFRRKDFNDPDVI
jgi:hypothetical protein